MFTLVIIFICFCIGMAGHWGEAAALAALWAIVMFISAFLED